MTYSKITKRIARDNYCMRKYVHQLCFEGGGGGKRHKHFNIQAAK